VELKQHHLEKAKNMNRLKHEAHITYCVE